MQVARFGVLGWPVAHSRSPAMQRAAFAAAGLRDHTYQRLPVPPELFDETVRALPGAGFRGANVTIPHKEAALALANEATPAAREIGAANTLSFEAGVIRADNTDAPGLLAALPLDPAGRRALVLGAGGSARAAIYALQGAGAEVLVWNRTADRARAVAGALGARAVKRPERADLLIHCTSLGLDGESNPLKEIPGMADLISEYACVTDLVYRDGGTELLTAARAAGAQVVDGLEILVRQGGLSFTRWTGIEAPLEAMREGTRAGSSN